MSNTCCHPFSRGHASVGQRAVSTTRSAGGDVSLLNHSFGDGSTTRRCSPQTPPGRVIVVVAIATGGGGGRRQRPTQPKTGVQQHIIHGRIFYSFSTRGAGMWRKDITTKTHNDRRRRALAHADHYCRRHRRKYRDRHIATTTTTVLGAAGCCRAAGMWWTHPQTLTSPGIVCAPMSM